MKRKLVKQGSSTLMISLPSKWIKANNLDKGSEIDLEETGLDLIIRANESKHSREKITFNASGYSILTNRILPSLYLKGYDEVEVSFTNKNDVKDFQSRVINELLGFEILKQSHNSMLIKDITGSEIKDIDQILNRVFFIIDSMIDEFIIALKEKQDLSPIIEIDSSLNKFCHYCTRNLMKYGYKQFEKTPQIYSIVSRLEEIGDSFKALAKIAQKEKISNEQITIIKSLKDSLKEFNFLLFNYSKEKTVDFAKNYESIKKEIKTKSLIDFYLFEINEDIIKLNNDLMLISV